ncbi:zinc finger protein 513 isoform X1 [Syngnathus scovelli]|uniref:zinc finger protein 513 isoform X1 n=1 Tax=Syngnathus scovelli TaxID=161590 RepID=UPI00210F66F8|nr:zinc finger protein 513 isoform X1 [Syngnathus scovelli]XP_049609703.1 zinc finger protein 513 isoform X1 [Syngnathus scovelli]XP_049609704.1 zinc finger protein 513 isoform X1 [Syngnathus scovelli]
MPRRKQSNPQPVKLELEDGSVAGNTGCLLLDDDVRLSGDLGFGKSEILPLDADSDVSGLTETAFPRFLSCKGCGQLLCDTPLGAAFDHGLDCDLKSDLYCLTCESDFQGAASIKSRQAADAKMADGSRKKRNKMGTTGELPPKVYSCSLCTFTSRYSNHLKRHMHIHAGEKPYRCPVCPYASTQLVNLKRHARTHTGEKPYRCHQCSHACSSLGNLRRHQRMHEMDRRPRRGKETTRAGGRKVNGKSDKAVSNRMRQVSQESAYLQAQDRLSSPAGSLPVLLFPLCCRRCGLTLDAMDVEDSDTQVCHRCSLDPLVKDGVDCPRSQFGPLESHQGGNQPYRCPLCPFLSHYPHHLARHAHIHAAEKPHRCPQCSYTSSHLDNLKRHLRVHTGEKPYQCPSCSYACGNLANLRRHERIHSGAKPFHCDICGYSCNQSMNLKRHMLRHTGEKPYACGECDYTTGHLDNYKRHQRKHGVDNWDRPGAQHDLGWVEEHQENQGCD